MKAGLTWMTAFGAACGDAPAPSSPGAPAGRWRRLEAIDAPPPVGPQDLCRALYVASGGAGLYEVIELRTNHELDPGFTWMELARLEAWTTLAPERPILRLPGVPGQVPEPGSASWIFGVKRHQQLALMLLPPMRDNQQLGSTTPQLVMRYEEPERRVYAPALPPQGVSVAELSTQLAQIEGRLGRPHEALRWMEPLRSGQAWPSPPEGACPPPAPPP